MNQAVLENFNVATNEMNEFMRIYDGVNSAILRVAQEAKKKSLLTLNHATTLLRATDTLLEGHSNLQDFVDGLKGAKDAILHSQETDVRACYNKIVTEGKEKRGNKDLEENETRARLKSVLQTENEGRRQERVLDESGNISLVLDEANSQFNHKCPITQVQIKNPIRNLHCGHVFERDAALKYIRDKKLAQMAARCPYIGCTNRKQFNEKDFEADHTFQCLKEQM